jgi:hypothetical protein
MRNGTCLARGVVPEEPADASALRALGILWREGGDRGRAAGLLEQASDVCGIPGGQGTAEGDLGRRLSGSAHPG